MNAPFGIEEVRRVFGNLKVDKDAQGGWRIISPIGWESANMIGVRDLPGLEDHKLYINKLIEQPLRTALMLWQATCPEYKIKTIGCWNVRAKANNPDSLSLHAWGIAVDINAATNPGTHVKEPFDPFPSDIPNAFVDAFRRAGWTWGADFNRGTYRDAMHFQYASGC